MNLLGLIIMTKKQYEKELQRQYITNAIDSIGEDSVLDVDLVIKELMRYKNNLFANH